jgi:hypothetical protein
VRHERRIGRPEPRGERGEHVRIARLAERGGLVIERDVVGADVPAVALLGLERVGVDAAGGRLGRLRDGPADARDADAEGHEPEQRLTPGHAVDLALEPFVPPARADVARVVDALLDGDRELREGGSRGLRAVRRGRHFFTHAGALVACLSVAPECVRA